MKKNKRHLYKRLPKYALGTMKPIDLGYQPGRGIGSARFETEQNMSLDPETQAIRRSYIPNAIGKLTQYSPYVTEAIKDWTPATNTATQQIGAVKPTGASRISPMSSQPAINTTSSVVPQMNIPGSTSNAVSSTAGSLTSRLANIASPYINTSALSQIASNAGTAASSTASSLGGSLSNALQSTLTNGAKSASEALLASAPSAATLNSEVVAANLGEKALENASSSGASAGAGALGVAGKVSAGLGAAIGAYNMYNDIAGFGDHRSASDMLANVGRSHVTTDYGNQYTAYNGVNAGQELAYEKANARSKQLGFGMNAIGTGASLGGLVGSIIPGAGTAIGSAIGALGGLIIGGLGSLFGWGDNSEEIERITRLTNDNIANYNRQGEAVARSKDVAAEFNDRQGVATAAEGKSAFGPMTSKKGDNINTPRFVFDISKPNNIGVDIPSSKLMPGETVVNKEDLSQWAVVPGKGNKDNVYSTVAPGDSNVVLTKKEGISKLGAAVLKSNAPESLKRWQINELEKRQQALQEQENQTEMKKYKNGKLPGFDVGKRSYMMPGISDYLMNLVPHLYEFGVTKYMQDRYKNASTYVPDTYVQNNGSANAINRMLSVKWDPTQALNDARKAYNQANWQANRMAGIGAGGQAILRNTNFLGYLDKVGDIRSKEQEINNNYTLAGLNKAIEYYDKQQQLLTDEAIRRFGWQQQQNAVKEYGIDLKGKDKASAFSGAGHDLYGVMQMARSMGIQNQMLDLYDRQVKNDTYKVFADYLNRQNNKPTAKYTYPSLLQQAAYATVGRTPQEAVFSSILRNNRDWKNFLSGAKTINPALFGG